MNRTILILLTFLTANTFLVCFQTFADSNKIDSLMNIIKTAKKDTTKIKALNNLALELMYNNPDTAIKLSTQALKLAKKVAASPDEALAKAGEKGIGKSYHNLGVFNGIIGNYNTTLDYFSRAKKIWEKLKDKSSLSATLGNIGIVYRNQGDYPKALEYYFKALKIAQELGNSPDEALAKSGKNGIARNLGNIGIVYLEQGDYPKALEHYFKALKIAEEIGNKNSIANWLGNIGNVYHSQGDYPKALEYYFKALKIAEEIGDKNRIAVWLGNIGIVYKVQGDYPKALEYYFKALKAAKELGYKQLQANTLGNIGLVYWNQGDYPKALEYFFKALKIYEEIGDKRGIAINLGSIGIVYHEQGKAHPNSSQREGLFNKALEHYFKALKIAEEIGDKNRIAVWLGNIGALYTKAPYLPPPDAQEKKGYALAEDFLLQALAISDSIGALSLQKDLHKMLSELYKKTSNYKKAYKHYEQYSTAKDSIFNEEKSKEFGRLEAGFEFEMQMLEEKKEHEKRQALSAEKLKKQKIIGSSFIGGFALVLILAFFIYRSYRQKKKANVQLERKNATITRQKEEIEQKNKNITDSIIYAERIQQAILPDEDYINEILGGHFILFKPRDIVSGDFYWAAKIKNWLLVAAADCTGHGVPGAFMSMLGVSFLNEIVSKEEITQTDWVLNELRDNVIKSLHQTGKVGEAQDGMDIALCALDTTTNKLQFSGAYNPLYIIRNVKAKGKIDVETRNVETRHASSMPATHNPIPQLIEIKADRMPIGIYTGEKKQFTFNEIQLQKGDTLYISSDGYIDQFGGEKGKKFKSKPFKELLLSIQDKSMEEQKTILNETFENWKGDLEQIDDVVVIGIRI